MKPIFQAALLLAIVLGVAGPASAQQAPPTGPETGIQSLPGVNKPPGVAGFEGRYTVAGTSPTGGRAYRGVVTVRRTGATYRVVWRVEGQRYVGTGINFGGILSIAYNGGVAVYRPSPDGSVTGRWAPNGSTRLGTEDWRRMP